MPVYTENERTPLYEVVRENLQTLYAAVDLDVEIGEWLLAAERIGLHVKLSYSSVFEYAARK